MLNEQVVIILHQKEVLYECLNHQVRRQTWNYIHLSNDGLLSFSA